MSDNGSRGIVRYLAAKAKALKQDFTLSLPRNPPVAGDQCTAASGGDVNTVSTRTETLRPPGSPPSSSAGLKKAAKQRRHNSGCAGANSPETRRRAAGSRGEQRGRCGWRLAAKAHQGESGGEGASSSGSGERTQSQTWLRFDGCPVVCICVWACDCACACVCVCVQLGPAAGGNGLRSVTAPRLRSAAGRATGASSVWAQPCGQQVEDWLLQQDIEDTRYTVLCIITCLQCVFNTRYTASFIIPGTQCVVFFYHEYSMLYYTRNTLCCFIPGHPVLLLPSGDVVLLWPIFFHIFCIGRCWCPGWWSPPLCACSQHMCATGLHVWLGWSCILFFGIPTPSLPRPPIGKPQLLIRTPPFPTSLCDWILLPLKTCYFCK